ncbi:MAG: transposase [Patescibacteria group bacterium]
MSKSKIEIGEYYHIYNRGNNKQDIFFEERDYIRFLFLLLYFQGGDSVYNIGRYVSNYVRHRMFNFNINIEKISKNKKMELLAFALMPNHFHFILKEKEQGGISKYLQRIQNSYTKYINTKNGKIGHLFQGSYQSVHIESNEQLLHLSAYVHRNPREIKKWKDGEDIFPWSSFTDYIKENRWGKLLNTGLLLGQFEEQEEYKNFVDESGTKLFLEEKQMLDFA